MRTKTQQITDKVSEHNGEYSIFSGFGPDYARINRSGVNFVLLTDSRIFQGIPGNPEKRPYGFYIPIECEP